MSETAQRDGSRPVVTVVTGLSGAGKTTALAALADLGHYVVDNLPPTLTGQVVRTLEAEGVMQVALGVDVRLGSFLDELVESIAALRDCASEVHILYLEASDEVIVRRFSETRRPHPVLARRLPEGQEPPATLADAVALERSCMSPIRDEAQRIVDTSHLTVHELRRLVVETFGEDNGALPMRVKLMSFGFKHGVPLDADLMFDVRFLDNPHFVEGLREQTGVDAPVRDFVMNSPGAGELIDKLEDLLLFSIPRYRQEGKSYLTIAIGCTGGRHRSVAVTAELARRISDASDERVGIVHRDVRRGAMMSEVTATRDSARGDVRRPERGEDGGD